MRRADTHGLVCDWLRLFRRLTMQGSSASTMHLTDTETPTWPGPAGPQVRVGVASVIGSHHHTTGWGPRLHVRLVRHVRGVHAGVPPGPVWTRKRDFIPLGIGVGSPYGKYLPGGGCTFHDGCGLGAGRASNRLRHIARQEDDHRTHPEGNRVCARRG